MLHIPNSLFLAYPYRRVSSDMVIWGQFFPQFGDFLTPNSFTFLLSYITNTKVELDSLSTKCAPFELLTTEVCPTSSSSHRSCNGRPAHFRNPELHGTCCDSPVLVHYNRCKPGRRTHLAGLWPEVSTQNRGDVHAPDSYHICELLAFYLCSWPD